MSGPATAAPQERPAPARKGRAVSSSATVFDSDALGGGKPCGDGPWHSLQRHFCLPWLHSDDPPHSLHLLFCLPWLHSDEPPHSLHLLFSLPWLHSKRQFELALSLSPDDSVLLFLVPKLKSDPADSLSVSLSSTLRFDHLWVGPVAPSACPFSPALLEIAKA